MNQLNNGIATLTKKALLFIIISLMNFIPNDRLHQSIVYTKNEIENNQNKLQLKLNYL